MDVETVVLAAGVWSRPLARQLGTSVPLEAERGYHVMFAGQDFSACAAHWCRPIATSSLAHMHEGIRATGVARVRSARRAGRHAHRRHDRAPRQGAGAGPEGRARLEVDGAQALASGLPSR